MESYTRDLSFTCDLLHVLRSGHHSAATSLPLVHTRRFVCTRPQVAQQLESGVHPEALIGEIDLPKIVSSLKLFERASLANGDEEVSQLCRRTIEALRKNCTETSTGQ